MSGKWKGKKVAVLLGGVSKERDISLRTGAAIASALSRKGYDCVSIDVRSGAELFEKIRTERPDVAVVALHGKFGEDGCVQGMLEMLRVPYTGGGVLASSVGMDKVLTSRIAKSLGIPCPEEESFDAEEKDAGSFVEKLKIKPPLIVKPSREGSTINMTIVKDAKEIGGAIKKALESDNRIVVQKYIEGKELTVGVLNGKALPVLEIAPKGGWYDYTSKYTKGMTDYIVPARIDDKIANELGVWAEMIYNEIECFGTARADFILGKDGDPVFLEINTIPGMTELSLVPKAAAHIGISFDDLCEKLLDGASLKVC